MWKRTIRHESPRLTPYPACRVAIQLPLRSNRCQGVHLQIYGDLPHDLAALEGALHLECPKLHACGPCLSACFSKARIMEVGRSNPGYHVIPLHDEEHGRSVAVLLNELGQLVHVPRGSLAHAVREVAPAVLDIVTVLHLHPVGPGVPIDLAAQAKIEAIPRVWRHFHFALQLRPVVQAFQKPGAQHLFDDQIRPASVRPAEDGGLAVAAWQAREF
mmetsp:Transcript_591/g.2166  ORF Transcript_591/g.2166 Transcript_591/m.2166 type:complete len:216 (-) Transcript_591:351-998(-)